VAPASASTARATWSSSLSRTPTAALSATAASAAATTLPAPRIASISPGDFSSTTALPFSSGGQRTGCEAGIPEVGGGTGQSGEAQPGQDRLAVRQRVHLDVAVAAGGGQLRPASHLRPVQALAAPLRERPAAPQPREVRIGRELDAGRADRLVS